MMAMNDDSKIKLLAPTGSVTLIKLLCFSGSVSSFVLWKMGLSGGEVE